MNLKIVNMRGTAAVVAALSAGVLAACGGSEPQSSGAAKEASSAADRSFVEDMTPHHESAVDMAKLAAKRAEHRQIKTLAADIATTQRAEIEEMAELSKSIGAKPGGASPMEMSEDDMATLGTADPFDRTFIDMMIPHHQDAIRMARTELEQGKDPGVRELAERILAAQSKEIRDMNEWRTEWYGKPSPAGGVPAASGSGGDHRQGHDSKGS